MIPLKVCAADRLSHQSDDIVTFVAATILLQRRDTLTEDDSIQFNDICHNFPSAPRTLDRSEWLSFARTLFRKALELLAEAAGVSTQAAPPVPAEAPIAGPRGWKPGQRLLISKEWPATLLAPVYDHWAFVFTDDASAHNHAPIAVNLDTTHVELLTKVEPVAK